MATKPENCPRRESHGRAGAMECSICGWRVVRTDVQPRKTFHDGAWRMIAADGSIGAKCDAPTADERGLWAAEDRELSATAWRFPQTFDAPPAGTRVYKVITQRDEFFAGQFDPEKLNHLINQLAYDGWRVVAITAADVSTFFGSFWAGRGARQEIIVFLEKTVE